MGRIQSHAPALCLMAVSSRYVAAIDWARERSQADWGEVLLASKAFEFRETDYYQSTMGAGLLKQFLVYAAPFDPEQTAERKIQSNAWEEEYAALGRHAEPRPLNLDPGYLTLAKLVLASTKDHAHRIYLRDGIYAEVTLYYKDKAWRAREWTFPDYRREDFQVFFSQARECLKRR